jgi:hypothetical protein
MLWTIVLFIIVLCFFYYYTLQYNEIRYIKSPVDGNVYAIRRGKDKSMEFLIESANILAEINHRINLLINHIDKKYGKGSEFYINAKMLKSSYHPGVISEAAIDKRYTTFTINKQDMHICLRTRNQDDKTYDINLLMYVIIHELAHMANFTANGYPIEGHGKEFKNIFKMLVKDAIEIGVYRYVNYEIEPKEYCGIIINTQIV